MSGQALASDSSQPTLQATPHHRATAKPTDANSCPDMTCREHHPPRPSIAKGLGTAAGLVGAGLLLHQLPPRVPKDGFKTMLPADWKVWARVILGIAAVQKLNQTINWKPPPWLGALQAVAIINPIAVGVTKNNFKQMLVMAPIIAGLVETASLLQKSVAKPMKDHYDTPPVLVRLGISLALGIGSLLAYPIIYRRIAATGIIGKELKEQAMNNSSAFASATFATCARGCSPGSFICLGEMADIVGSFGNWNEPKIMPATNSDSPPDTSSPKAAPKSTALKTQGAFHHDG
jgi:hypothetical protein